MQPVHSILIKIILLYPPSFMQPVHSILIILILLYPPSCNQFTASLSYTNPFIPSLLYATSSQHPYHTNPFIPSFMQPVHSILIILILLYPPSCNQFTASLSYQSLYTLLHATSSQHPYHTNPFIPSLLQQPIHSIFIILILLYPPSFMQPVIIYYKVYINCILLYIMKCI